MNKPRAMQWDGFLLILFGSYIVVLCLTGKYSLYLHHKFMWLSLVSALILWGLGFFKVFLSNKPMTNVQRIILIVFLGICLFISPQTVEMNNLLQLPF